MGITKNQLIGLISALGAILSFRASVEIPKIGMIIKENPYIIMGVGVALIIFSGGIAGWFVKT